MCRSLPFLVFFTALPAAAESPRAALFPGDVSCYRRQYDLDHLAAHPDQLVTQIALGPEAGADGGDVLILRVAVRVRGSDERFLGSAYCENAGAELACGLEGDGGRFTLGRGKKGALTLKVGADPLGFEGEKGFISFGAGASDDDTFLIPKVTADACP